MYSNDCILKGPALGTESVRCEGESKSKGKIHLTALIEVTVSNFYISFFYIVPLQHNAFVISFS